MESKVLDDDLLEEHDRREIFEKTPVSLQRREIRAALSEIDDLRMKLDRVAARLRLWTGLT